MAKIRTHGHESLHHIKAIEPPQWLAPSIDLSKKAREASQYLFSSLKPFTPESPFENLLVEGFDAEQIWQQIDLQTQPLLSALRRDVKRFENNPGEILKTFGDRKVLVEKKKNEVVKGNVDAEIEDMDDVDEDDDEDDDDDEEGEGESSDGEEDDDDEEEKESGRGGIEDRFLKIKELEEYLDDDEEKEYGLKTNKKKNKRKGRGIDSEEEDDEEDEDKEEDDEEDDDKEEDDEDEFGEFGLDDDEDDQLGNSRYSDFFGDKKKKDVKRKSDLIDGSEDSETDDEQKKGPLSTHEKKLLKLRSEIEQMEQANMDKKTWIMQGEVTASKRPLNSALEADLDFEHNMRPAPVITEEVTASIEELIKKRILEGRFDDVQKAPSLPSKAPREHKELDENKSQKGLAEIYAAEYVQTTNPDSAPLTFSDERKKEASMLFKQLCLKLDALSHFHFTPKPVIEEMSIQTNVPALAIEEIAPVAVSDAAMLAPEEVFSGKGDIKEDAELTQAERKMRRSNKKRKFKAETTKRTVAKKARQGAALNGKEMDS